MAGAFENKLQSVTLSTNVGLCSKYAVIFSVSFRKMKILLLTGVIYLFVKIL